VSKLSDYDLHEALSILRQRARHLRHGPQAALWDLILETEAVLQGKLSARPREEIEREIERELAV
jgi:hypothetical protein